MKSKRLTHSRRDFLEFTGKSGIASHAIKSSSLVAGLLANRYAHAKDEVKRVVFIYTPLGSPNGLWLPSGNTLNLATAAYEGLQPDCHFHETEVVGGGFGQIWRSLGEVRYVNDWTSDTIDHQIAKVLGIATPNATLHFGVQAVMDIGATESFSRKNSRPVIPMEGPTATYERLFGMADNKIPARFTDNSRKRNVLDAHLQALNCSRAQLSLDEINTIDQYEISLNMLKSKLTNSDINAAACHRPEWNRLGLDISNKPESGRGIFAHEAYLQADIITQALACGLTNVATLQLGDDQGSFVGHDTQFKGDLHQASCGASLYEYAEMVNYLSRCVAYFIRQLADQDDPAVPGTKLLDNTIVLQVSNQGFGPEHNGSNGPNLLATRMPAFKTGIATPQKAGGDVNLKVLQTVAAGLGLEQYIGKDNHHCIWPCGEPWGGVDTDFLT